MEVLSNVLKQIYVSKPLSMTISCISGRHRRKVSQANPSSVRICGFAAIGCAVLFEKNHRIQRSKRRVWPPNNQQIIHYLLCFCCLPWWARLNLPWWARLNLIKKFYIRRHWQPMHPASCWGREIPKCQRNCAPLIFWTDGLWWNWDSLWAARPLSMNWLPSSK